MHPPALQEELIQRDLGALRLVRHAFPMPQSIFALDSDPELTEVPMLDRFLPLWDVRECHHLEVAAPADRAFNVLRNLDVNRSPIVHALFWLRELPFRLRRRGAVAPPHRSLLEDALSAGWIVLDELPGQQLAVGSVTKPWEPVVTFRGLPGPELRAFREPGYVKIGWGIAVRAAGPGSSVLGTETRVLATDDRSRRRFQRYWFFFGPFIGLIRRIALRMARKELAAEAPAAQ
jgi:hypothetical protein